MIYDIIFDPAGNLFRITYTYDTGLNLVITEIKSV